MSRELPARYVEAGAEIETLLTDDELLAPASREIAILAVVRRSAAETEARLDAARRAGLSDAVIAAIADENWAHEAFDDVSKAVFRFAMMYDAGHGVAVPILGALRAQLDETEIRALAAVCDRWGARARTAIAFGAG